MPRSSARHHPLPWLPVLRGALFALPLLFLAIFYLYPLATIIAFSFRDVGWAASGLTAILTDSYFWGVIWFSIWQAALSTLLTLLVGLPAAYVFARYALPGATLLRALATVPFVLPTVVVAAAFAALLGPQGLINTLLQALLGRQALLNLQNTLTLILIAHVFYNFSVVLRLVGGFWANLDPRVEEAARVLGASRWRVWWEVTLPLLLPAVLAAALLIFLFTFTAFGTVLILGGPRFATIEVEIYRQAVNFFNLPVAAALSILQIVITLALTVVYTRLQERASRPLELRPQAVTRLPLIGWRRRLLAGAVIALIAVLLLLPLLALAYRSLTLGGRWTLAYYQLLSLNQRNEFFFVPPLTAVRHSLLFAGATTLLALLIGVPAAYLLTRRGALRAIFDPLFILPLGTSAVTLGFGYIITFDTPPLNLRTSPLLIPLAHTLIAFPFVVRAVLPALRAINPRLREAAAVQGAGPLRVLWEVDVPIVARAVLVGAVFAFTVSMGEFGATLLINLPQYPTMPVLIYRFLGLPGVTNYGQALAMSTLLMLVTTLGFVAIERFRLGDIGEF
ncbi:ABC transporter permease [Kallotenue papyrolyticum]|uniref:ABC transporter permease n=1 Tax=Kallotenue papyrolyticum TaxID=1325125 RepID=UPI0004B55F99|nr:iron ABC transporter permease [Kallotenue papyrolyticum]